MLRRSNVTQVPISNYFASTFVDDTE